MSMLINPYKFGASSAPSSQWSPQYDTVSGQPVVGAWGVRKLVSTYTGPLVRIRDTVGSAEQDVGIGSDGWLATFSVGGNAAVVKVYDQSGNGNHIEQANTAKQPLLVRPGVSVSGRPAIRFDGSDDYLRDETLGTAKAYMVGHPIVIIEAAGRGSIGAWGPFAAVPHVGGANTNPYNRWVVQRNGSGEGVSISLSIGGSSSTAGYTRELQDAASIGTLFLCVNADAIIDGIASSGGPAAAGASVTYPNATSLILGTNGGGGEPSNNETTAIVILSDSVSSIATIQSWHDTVHHKGLAKVADKVLDVSFASDPPSDTSDRGHPVGLANGATISSGRFDPTVAGGAAVITPSGLQVPTADYTFECEIYPTSLIVNRTIMDKRVGNIGWTLSMHDVNSDELMVVLGEFTSGQYLVTGEHGSQANITTGAWHTIRFTKSGSTCKLYCDGVERASRTISTTTATLYTARPMLIGNSHTRNSAFPGYIRNVKAWSGVALVP